MGTVILQVVFNATWGLCPLQGEIIAPFLFYRQQRLVNLSRWDRVI